MDGVHLSLASGQLLALFGPNGAGKSTVLGLLSGSLRPTEGDVRIDGRLLDANDRSDHHKIGVLSHETFLYKRLTAAENLRFFGRLYRLDALEARVQQGLDAVGLGAHSGSEVRTFSRGMRQRLALARTLLHDPAIVLLDEPWTGLDAHAADMLRGVLASLRDGRRTVVLVTHNLTQGLALADRVAIQVRGRLVHEAPAGGLTPAEFEGFYRDTVDGAA